MLIYLFENARPLRHVALETAVEVIEDTDGELFTVREVHEAVAHRLMPSFAESSSCWHAVVQAIRELREHGLIVPVDWPSRGRVAFYRTSTRKAS